MERYFKVEDSIMEAVSFNMSLEEGTAGSLYSEMLNRPKNIKAKGTVEDLVIELAEIIVDLQKSRNYKAEFVRGCFTLKPFVTFPILIIANGRSKLTVKEIYNDIAVVIKLAVDYGSKSQNVRDAFSTLAKGSHVNKFKECNKLDWHNFADRMSLSSIMSQKDLTKAESDLFNAVMMFYEKENEA